MESARRARGLHRDEVPVEVLEGAEVALVAVVVPLDVRVVDEAELELALDDEAEVTVEVAVPGRHCE